MYEDCLPKGYKDIKEFSEYRERNAARFRDYLTCVGRKVAAKRGLVSDTVIVTGSLAPYLKIPDKYDENLELEKSLSIAKRIHFMDNVILRQWLGKMKWESEVLSYTPPPLKTKVERIIFE